MAFREFASTNKFLLSKIKKVIYVYVEEQKRTEEKPLVTITHGTSSSGILTCEIKSDKSTVFLYHLLIVEVSSDFLHKRQKASFTAKRSVMFFMLTNMGRSSKDSGTQRFAIS